MREAKKEFGKALLNLANMFLVLFLFNTYFQKQDIDLFIVMLFIYATLSVYFVGFWLIKEGSDE
ncbi:MAG: hypothetical protein GXO62_05820 [Epsilonproteobacteria bacterium]|nr:hypothetical protein [Campylobacterota bacterium]